MEVAGIIIAILWSLMSLLLVVEYGPLCVDLSKKDKAIVLIIFMIGGPILAAANILEAILNTILPQGWGGDDDNDFQGH